MPVPEIVPLVVVQVTAGFVAFWVVPLNCCLVDDVTVAVPGLTTTASGGITVTMAVADLVGSSTLVAVTLIMVFCVTFGEVNMPPPETVPRVAVHVTRVTSVLVTVAVKICCFSAFMVTEVGLKETPIGGVTVTVAVAKSLESARLVAVTVMVVSLLTVGAVNRPAVVIVPLVVDHFTDVSVLPVTFEVNCCVNFEGTLGVFGVM
jgi:hypothetical protein